MKKIVELKQDLATARKALEDKMNAGEDTAEARSTVENIMKSIKDQELLDAAAMSARNDEVSHEEKEANKNFSFSEFFREAAAGRLSGLYQEMHDEAVREARAIGTAVKNFGIPSMVLKEIQGQSVDPQNKGGYLVGEEPIRYFEALQNKLFFSKVGANIITGLVGDLPLVTGGAFQGGWYEEGADASVEKVTLGQALMQPHRIAVVGALTKQLLNQSTPDAEQLIINALTQAHARVLESGAISGTGSAGQPTGLLNLADVGSVVIDENGGPVTYAKVVELESAAAANNGDTDSMYYLTNSKVIGQLKTTSTDAGSGRFIMENGYANGYGVIGTNAVPSDLTKGSAVGTCSALIFGDFRKLYIGQWGGLDVVVDPYTLAQSGQIKIILDAYHDVAAENPKHFAIIKDIVA